MQNRKECFHFCCFVKGWMSSTGNSVCFHPDHHLSITCTAVRNSGDDQLVLLFIIFFQRLQRYLLLQAKTNKKKILPKNYMQALKWSQSPECIFVTAYAFWADTRQTLFTMVWKTEKKIQKFRMKSIILSIKVSKITCLCIFTA